MARVSTPQARYVRDSFAEIVRSQDPVAVQQHMSDTDVMLPARRTGQARSGRVLTVRADHALLHIPRIDSMSFTTGEFESLALRDQALILTIFDAAAQRTASRLIQSIARELRWSDVPETVLHSHRDRLRRSVSAWNHRSLDGRYPFLMVNAFSIRIRHGSRALAHQVSLAVAIGDDGYRHIVGIHIGDPDTKPHWSVLLRSLKERGLEGVDTVVAPRVSDLQEALAAVFPDALWQQCHVDAMETALALSPSDARPNLQREIRRLLDAPEGNGVQSHFTVIEREYGVQAPKSVEYLRSALGAITATAHFPSPYCPRLRTTRPVSQLIAELSRSERLVRGFPGVDSAEHLIGAVLLEIHREWSSGNRYLQMDAYYRWKRKCKTMNGPDQSSRVN